MTDEYEIRSRWTFGDGGRRRVFDVVTDEDEVVETFDSEDEADEYVKGVEYERVQ